MKIKNSVPYFVIPEKAGGIRDFKDFWMPVCTGMTDDLFKHSRTLVAER